MSKLTGTLRAGAAVIGLAAAQATIGAAPTHAVSCVWAGVECSPDDGGFCILTRHDGSKEVWSLADVAAVYPECLGLPDDGVLDSALDILIPPELSATPDDQAAAELLIMVTPRITPPTAPRLPDIGRLDALVASPAPAVPAPVDAVPERY